MTPVDMTAAERGGSPSAASARWAISAASIRPASPVQALAQPALIATARRPAAFSATNARSYSTGAAGNALRVKVAAAPHGRSLTISARSRAPVFLIPAATPAKVKPRGVGSGMLCSLVMGGRD